MRACASSRPTGRCGGQRGRAHGHGGHLSRPRPRQVCNGPDSGTPDLDSVTCSCQVGWGGPLCETCAVGYDPDAGCSGGCLSGFWGPFCTPCANCGQHGSCVGSGSITPVRAWGGGGGGVGCSLRAINPPRPPPPLPQVPNQGQCKCATGWGGTYCGQCATGYAGTLCQTCADGFWGSSCSACPACGANGACSGNGTKGGSGACICANGWTGPLCTVPPPSSSSSSSGTPPADAGAIAAGVIFGVLGAAAIGVFVYARFFGGGPAVAAAWAATVRTLSFGTGSSAKLERTSLMSSGAAATRLGSSSAY